MKREITEKVPIDQDPRFQIPLYLTLGVFCGLLIGLVGFNAANSFGPTSTDAGTIRSTDIVSNLDNPSRGPTYYVVGETESGRTWRFPSEAAYDLFLEGGSSVPTQITFSDITGTAVGLQVGEIDERLTGMANRIFFAGSTLFAILATALGAWLMRKSGLSVVLPFIVGVVPIGSWLGYIAMRAWRGG